MTVDNVAQSSGLSFADPTVAIRARDAIRKIAIRETENLGTNPQVGRVMAVDIARLKASVWFAGDDSPVEVGMFPGAIPVDLGNYRGTTVVETSAVGTGGIVYVENFRGQPYITRILSGGEYTLNQRVAGLTHQTFNATRQGTLVGPPVNDIYERHVNIKLDGGVDFTVGKCMLVGPWAGTNDGSMIDGIVEIVISFMVSGNVKQCVRKYEFSISDRMVVDLEGDEGNKSFWMRVLPEKNLATNPPAELALDVALVKTNIRAPIEFWLRLVPLDGNADQSVYMMSVKTYGSAFNVGDPRTGRIIAILQGTVEPLQGYLGFNNSSMGWPEKDEYTTWPHGVGYFNESWSSGPYRSAPLRLANDLRPLWRNTGQWIWNGSGIKWEGNIVFTGVGPDHGGLYAGSLVVPFPTSSIQILPTTTNGQYRALSGGTIPLNAGETLYYGMAPGMGTGGANDWSVPEKNFFIVDSKTHNAAAKPFSLPEWAIPICTRTQTANAEARDFFVCNPVVDKDLADETRYAHFWYTANHGPLVVADETETMFLPSFRYRSKQAYMLSFKTGVISSTSSSSVMMFQWRKGALDTGTQWGEQFRFYAPPSTWGTGPAQGFCYVINNTGADIVTDVVLTALIPTGAPACTRVSNSGAARSWVRVEHVGSAYKFVDIGINIA